jgi:chemotaxis protein MotB
VSRSWRSTRPDRRRALGLEPAPLDDDQTGWLMTFSDLVLQLFAFVLVSVVLSAGGRPSAAVDPAPSSRSPVAMAAEVPRCPHVEERPEKTAAEPPEKTVEERPEPPPDAEQPSDADRPRDAAAERLAAAGRGLQEFVAAEGRADAVQVAVRDSDLIVTLSDSISFASGSAELLPVAAPILHRIGALAQGMPDFDLEVDGHTDDRPIHTGGFPSNLELSLARAARVVHELTAGTPELAERAIAAGYGEHRPIAPNADETGRARNRRVEIRLVPRAQAPSA